MAARARPWAIDSNLEMLGSPAKESLKPLLEDPHPLVRNDAQMCGIESELVKWRGRWRKKAGRTPGSSGMRTHLLQGDVTRGRGHFHAAM
jgi:hypothetical protein